MKMQQQNKPKQIWLLIALPPIKQSFYEMDRWFVSELVLLDMKQRIIQTFYNIQLLLYQKLSMQEQQSIQKPQAIESKILKVQKKGNELKVLGNTKSRLLIQNNTINPSDEEIIEELEASRELISRPKTRKMNSLTEDYVDLPKINFLKEASNSRSRKGSEVNIDIRQVQDQLQDVSKRSFENLEKSQDSEQKENQNAEWGNWNINNINIIPSKNNYVQEENYDYLSIPSNNNIKSTSLEINRQNNRQNNRSRQRSRDRKRSEKDRNEERKLFKERQRRERERNIQIVSEFLSGKASVIWLFILNSAIKEQNLKEIKELYKNHMENDYEVPICRSYNEALKFLKIQSCFYKIVADVQSSQKLIEESSNHKNIIAIYIYNPKGEMKINRSFELKKVTKKIKGMFLDLSDAAKQATEQIENQPKFIQVDNQLEQERTKLRFPSFMILTGYDTTQVTAYRLCLYGSLKLKDRKQRSDYLKEFTDMVELRYAQVPKELNNLEQYKKIDHLDENNEKKSREILNFYVRQSFYYVLLNSILRLSRSSEEFRPCTIPFNQTYHAIKHYYMRYREQSGKSCKKMVTFRGSKLRNNDAKSLQIGSYIQLLGFTSTSLKRSEAQKFMDNDSYLFQIIVDKFAENDNELFYDHGFVEINRYGLANEAYTNEQEVLFNALNIFKVIEIDLTSAVRKITLRYGAIFDLLRSRPEDLSPHERAVIANYQYCTRTYNQIEDDGDVLLLAQQHDRCVDYYQAKIDQGQINYKIYGKIANAQYENGDLEEAYNNALRSIQELNREAEKNPKEASQNYSKYEKNKNIFEAKEDLVHFKTTIQKYVKILGQDWFSQAKLFKQRGEKCLKSGDLESCNTDLMKCKQILKQKQQSFQKRRKEINRRYLLRSFCCMCSRSATRQLEEQRQLELLKIQEDQVNFQHKKDQIHQLYFEIENLLKELAEKTGNKQLQNASKQAAALHFNSMQKKNDTQSPLIVAKYLVMEAAILQNSEKDSDHYEQLMESAINQVKKQDPFHEQLGIYQNLLGAKRHANIKRRLLLDPIQKQDSQDAGIAGGSRQDTLRVQKNNLKIVNDFNSGVQVQPETVKYNYEKQDDLYKKSKESFCEAAENIAYNKGSEHPDYLSVRNNITQLDLDFSRLRESSKTADQSKQIKLVNNHSEGAKCYLLIAKICLAKGELKNSFKNIELAHEILKKSLVKIDSKQYNNIFMNHPYYMEISLQKVKIFNRQLKHDLALKQLAIAKKIAKIKVQNMHSKVILSAVYEQQASILICMGETISFEEYLMKAINIRSEQIGKFNIPNAISYSNLFKYLRLLNDADDALTYHHKAIQIFARFPSDHPNAWVIHLSNGLYFYQKKEIDKFIQQMEYCIKVASKRYSANHINILKIMFQYGKMLISVEEYDKGLNVFLRLERDLQESLNESLRGIKIQKEIDDEKIPLRKNLYTQLKQIYSRSKDSAENTSIEQLKRCEKKLKDFQYLAQSQEKLMKSNISIK